MTHATASPAGALPPPAAAPAAAPAARRMVSIRTKGLIAFAGLIVYSLMIAAFAFHQKSLLLQEFTVIQDMLETEAMIKQADVAAFESVMSIVAKGDSADRAAGTERIAAHHRALLELEAMLAERLPGTVVEDEDMRAAWLALNRDPSNANLNRMMEEVAKVKTRLLALTGQIQAARGALAERFQRQSDSVALTVFLLGMLGLALLGALIFLFFRRMSDDLGSLQRRSVAIVRGGAEGPMPVTRRDEVGQLMMAINDMAETLERRDRELLLERQKYFHQEKMAAIGSLAAGIAHEIGNPIAAISGIAQEMVDRRNSNGASCGTRSCLDCHPEIISAQVQRLAGITREIAEFASPRALEPEWLDLNAQLRSTRNLVRYDKRLHSVKLDLELDDQLPAIYGVADHLTQLIMNLIINAVDALDGIAGREPAIRIVTSVEVERVRMSVQDNGQGMDGATRERAFEAFFTTKPAGKGTGLGLSLCYAITRAHGGTIDIQSSPGLGTSIELSFPLNDTSYNQTGPQ